MKLKVCGMKINDNIKEVAKLLPDFMGFIFWPKTKRFFSEKEISIPNHVKKVGVFVNQDLDLIKKNVKKFGLDFVQLHGNENQEFCSEVNSFCKVIKVFHLSENFNFEKLIPYENSANIIYLTQNLKSMVDQVKSLIGPFLKITIHRKVSF